MVKQLFLPKSWNFLFLDSHPENIKKMYNSHDPSKFIYSCEKNFRSIWSMVGFEYFVNRNWMNSSLKFISIGDKLFRNSARDSQINDESFEYILQCVDKLAMSATNSTNPISNEITVVYHGEDLHKKKVIEDSLSSIKDCLFFEKRYE